MLVEYLVISLFVYFLVGFLVAALVVISGFIGKFTIQGFILCWMVWPYVVWVLWDT